MSGDSYIDVWTDYQELNPTPVISNHTGHVINITKEASNKLCVILEAEQRKFKGNLKKMPCNRGFSVVCRGTSLLFFMIISMDVCPTSTKALSNTGNKNSCFLPSGEPKPKVY